MNGISVELWTLVETAAVLFDKYAIRTESTMSTGKRLAKRSIIGTRVAALSDDGLYYSGMIQAVKTPAAYPENNNCINLTPNTRYTVRFDGGKIAREYRDAELIGPGFRGLTGVRLNPGQRVYLTYNGREVRADVLEHDHETDELRVQVHAPAAEVIYFILFRIFS